VRRFAAHAAHVGGRARYTEVAGAGHDVWRQTFAHEPVWEWLFAQRRSG
jgi:hypothetical protein